MSGKITSSDSTAAHLKALGALRDEEDTLARRINKIHGKLQTTAVDVAEKFGDKLWMKLHSLYEKAKEVADDEHGVCAKLIKELEAIVGIMPASGKRKSDHKKRKRQKLDPDDSGRAAKVPLAGQRVAADTSGILVGDQVAARRSPDDAPKDDWILVKVTKFDRENNKYEVIDEEPGEDEEIGQSKKYRLPSACIIPLPKHRDPTKSPDFPPGSIVLAVYPGTTALYRAAVTNTPRKRKSEHYFLAFDDDEEEGVDGLPQRQVPFYHTVHLPQGHRQ